MNSNRGGGGGGREYDNRRGDEGDYDYSRPPAERGDRYHRDDRRNFRDRDDGRPVRNEFRGPRNEEKDRCMKEGLCYICK